MLRERANGVQRYDSTLRPSVRSNKVRPMQVGLTLPVTPDDGGNATWSHIERLASLADFGGADSLWLADHFLYHGSRGEVGFHEPFALLAAIAATTRRVALGTLVAAASFRSPGLLARTCVTLDAISSGRMILGLGSGWYEPEYRAFGYPFDHLVGRFRGDSLRRAPAARWRASHTGWAMAASRRCRDRACSGASDPARRRGRRSADDGSHGAHR